MNKTFKDDILKHLKERDQFLSPDDMCFLFRSSFSHKNWTATEKNTQKKDEMKWNDLLLFQVIKKKRRKSSKILLWDHIHIWSLYGWLKQCVLCF